MRRQGAWLRAASLATIGSADRVAIAGTAGTDVLTARVVGRRGALLALALKTTVLTVATLGLYSFWSRTRIRRWLWSSVEIGGAPLEYVGRPQEKLMGFVLAACLVATYLGVVVMLLVFTSLTLFRAVMPGFVAAAILVLPVYWFATYRGMRYLLGHTRWRGLSFSMTPGAWGYAARATGWTALTLATAGLALPWRTQRLWRYRTDRTFYGDVPFRLVGGAWPLARIWMPIWLGLLLTIFAWVAAIATLTEGALPLPPALAGAGTVLAPAFAVWLWVRWRVRSFARLVSDLRWGDRARVVVAPRIGRIVGIHLGGWILVALLLGAALIAAGIAMGLVAFSAIDVAAIEADLTGGALSPYLLLAGGLLTYLLLFQLRAAFRLAFVTFPLLRHVGEDLSVTPGSAVAVARPGTHRHMADADGFANLFDLGAGL